MQERRKEPRKPLMAYSQVFDLYGGRLLGYLGDLTMKGAMVIGDRMCLKIPGLHLPSNCLSCRM